VLVTNAVRQIDPAPEARQQARTHLFVSATLYAGSSSRPVHVRNMSQFGALIEGDELPEVGERVRLKRGQLQAAGWIAWRVGRKAGVKLEASAQVSDWMSRQVSNSQERVDALVSIARNDASKAAAVAAKENGRMPLEVELGQLRAELAELESALLADVILVATHPEIQTLDISVQRIDRILTSLRAE
jgi:hypothetical protein